MFIAPSNNDATTSISGILKVIAQKGDQVTFRDIYEQIWLPKKRSTISSWKQEARRIESILLPAIGDIPVKDITPQVVIPCLVPYENKLPTLQRLCMRVNEVMNFALCADLIDRNRCAKMRVIYPHHRSIHVPTLAPSQLPLLFYELSHPQPPKRVPPIWFSLLVLYQLYAMARCHEVVNLKWEYFHDDVIIMPPEIMKGRRPHRIWLCPEMVEVMKIVYVLSESNPSWRRSPYVFNFTTTVTGHTHPQHFTKWLWQSSLAGMVTPHGLRSTGRTWLRDAGCPHEVGEDFLSHVYGSPRQRELIYVLTI
jgi:integrase